MPLACHRVSVLSLPSVLTLRSVHVWFADGPHVLHALDLDVGPGEHWALLGPNGAGKSTLLALAGAQRHPSRGEVDVLGSRIGRVDLRVLGYFVVALVQLEEGPRMFSNVVGVDNDAVKVGDKLEVVFDPVTPEVTLPRFKLRGMS